MRAKVINTKNRHLLTPFQSQERGSVTRSNIQNSKRSNSFPRIPANEAAAARRAALRQNRSVPNSSRNRALLQGQSFGSSTSAPQAGAGVGRPPAPAAQPWRCVFAAECGTSRARACAPATPAPSGSGRSFAMRQPTAWFLPPV